MRRLSTVIAAMLLMLSSLATHTSAAQLVTTYPVGAGPFAVVADPTDGRVYVANSSVRTIHGTGSISVIDPATGSVTDQDTSKPSGLLALDPAARRLYSSNYESSNGGSQSLDVIDLTTGRWLTSLPIGGLGVALDATRGRAFVAGGSYIASVDTVTFAVTTRGAPPSESWFGVATDPALGRVYVTNIAASHPSLVVLDANDLHTIADISLPSVARYAIAADTLRSRVYVAGPNASGIGSTVSVIDATSFIAHTQALPFFVTGLALAPSMHRLWLTDFDGRELVPLDDETLLSVESATRVPWNPYLATFARDGLLYVSGPGASVVGAFDVNVFQPPVNRPPVIDSATVSPTEARTNDVVTLSVQAHDPEGDVISITYQWSVNHFDRPGETGPSLDLSGPGNGDRNDLICVNITVSDAEFHPSTSWCMLFVLDSAPAAVVALDTTAPTTNAVIHASVAATDVDGDLLTYTYTWTVNGTSRRVATTSSPTDAFDLAATGNGDRGDLVAVSVVASDGTFQSLPATASVTVANSGPVTTVALSDSTPEKHDLLVATATSFDPDGDALSYTFTWRINGAVRQTTTVTSAQSSFDLRRASAKVADRVTVDVTVSDGAATAAASASATVTPAGR